MSNGFDCVERSADVYCLVCCHVVWPVEVALSPTAMWHIGGDHFLADSTDVGPTCAEVAQ
jgi:hypothetical protein